MEVHPILELQATRDYSLAGTPGCCLRPARSPATCQGTSPVGNNSSGPPRQDESLDPGQLKLDDEQ